MSSAVPQSYMSEKLNERFPRLMRGIHSARILDLPWQDGRIFELLYKDGTARTLKIYDMSELHEKLQELETTLRPKESWEFHKR